MNTSVNKSSAAGFTMIEVMLVLGVSSLLLLMTFFGQGLVTQQARFRDAVETLRVQLETARNEANNTVALSETGCSGLAGTSANCIIFGRLVRFPSGEDVNSFTVQTLIANGPGVTSGNLNTRVENPRFYDGDITEHRLRWGLRPLESGVNQIAFVRHAGTGGLETHFIGSDQSVTDAASYSSANTRYVLRLVDDSCNRADIVLNDPANTIRVEFQDKSC